MTAIIISNEEMDDNVKLVKLLEESVLLEKDFSNTNKNKARAQKGRFLPM